MSEKSKPRIISPVYEAILTCPVCGDDYIAFIGGKYTSECCGKTLCHLKTYGVEVDSAIHYFANAEPHSAEEALTVCEYAEKILETIQAALIELSEIELPEVDAILDRYITKL